MRRSTLIYAQSLLSRVASVIGRADECCDTDDQFPDAPASDEETPPGGTGVAKPPQLI